MKPEQCGDGEWQGKEGGKEGRREGGREGGILTIFKAGSIPMGSLTHASSTASHARRHVCCPGYNARSSCHTPKAALTSTSLPFSVPSSFPPALTPVPKPFSRWTKQDCEGSMP